MKACCPDGYLCFNSNTLLCIAGDMGAFPECSIKTCGGLATGGTSGGALTADAIGMGVVAWRALFLVTAGPIALSSVAGLIVIAANDPWADEYRRSWAWLACVKM